MRFLVDLALQDLLGARNSDRRYLSTQLFARAIRFLLDVGLRGGQLPLTLLDAVCFASLHDLVCQGIRLIDNTRCPLARIANNIVGLCLRLLELLLGLVERDVT